MSNTPFAHKELAKPGILHRLTRREPRANAVLELNNLLASSSIDGISHEDVERLETKYSVDLLKKYPQELEDIYELYLQYVLKDQKLDEDEIRNLKHLKHLLGLTDKVVGSIHDKVVLDIYKMELQAAVEDGRLDEEEKTQLERIRNELAVPQELADRIYDEARKARVQSAWEEAISDERLSPDEEAELGAIAKSLDVTTQTDEETKETLAKYRLLWTIENGEIPTIEPNINLQRGESCYFEIVANWHEHRRQTTRIRYSGPTARIRIAKGIYWRAGDLGVKPVSQDVLKLIDTGSLYLTNKRLIFMGSKGNKTIRLSKILSLEPFKNGVQIEKDAGKSPFLEFSHNVDIFSTILDKAIKDA
jgi:hypothetical protein